MRRLRSIMTRARLRGFVLPLLAVLLAMGSAAAEDAIPKSAVVLLKASGSGEGEESKAMGVVVSPYGLVLTTYSLLSNLENVDPRDISIQTMEDTPRAAWPVDVMAHVGLLLLQLDRSDELYEAATLSQRFQYPELATGDGGRTVKSYMGKVPELGEVTRSHQILSFSARKGFWGVDGDLDDAYDGTPFFDSDGGLVGLLSPKETTASFRALIPTEYADALLVGLKFKEIRDVMQRRLKDFDPLRSELRWTANETAGGIEIIYKKRVLGEPMVGQIDVDLYKYAVINGQLKLLGSENYSQTSAPPGGVPLKGPIEFGKGDGGAFFLQLTTSSAKFLEAAKIIDSRVESVVLQLRIQPFSSDRTSGAAVVFDPATVDITLAPAS
ncbi:serine protease [Acuticoccus kandeliae]|uniref:serine protease n=1 Tax=Acuticoccus kandeliae TaxID=2073160 RepID=UPI001300B140|nr:serine protease [Acuticoccus kandeliae]